MPSFQSSYFSDNNFNENRPCFMIYKNTLLNRTKPIPIELPLKFIFYCLSLVLKKLLSCNYKLIAITNAK